MIYWTKWSEYRMNLKINRALYMASLSVALASFEAPARAEHPFSDRGVVLWSSCSDATRPWHDASFQGLGPRRGSLCPAIVTCERELESISKSDKEARSRQIERGETDEVNRVGGTESVGEGLNKRKERKRETERSENDSHSMRREDRGELI